MANVFLKCCYLVLDFISLKLVAFKVIHSVNIGVHVSLVTCTSVRFAKHEI